MQRNYFKILSLGLFFLLSNSFLGNAVNVRHDPGGLFDTLPGGRQVFNAPRAFGVDSVHRRGITGNDVSIAFIDNFDPDQHIRSLIDRGVIHQTALQDKTFISPDEHLDQINLADLRQNVAEIRLDYLHAANEGEKSRIEKILDQACLRVRKKEMLTLFNTDKETARAGIDKIAACEMASRMLYHFHEVAPDAKIFPLDFSTVNTDWGVYRETGPGVYELTPEVNIIPRVSLARTIRKAIGYGVDAVFVGDFCARAFGVGYQYTDDDFDALEELKDSGVALIYNGALSRRDNPQLTSPVVRIFERFRGQGLLFTGPHKYDFDGEERFDNADHEAPELLIRDRVVLAPKFGSSPFSEKNVARKEVSSARCMGAFALLKQHARIRGLPHTTDALLQILHDSGHNLSYSRYTYKVLDIPNALEFAEGRTGGSPYIARDPNPRRFVPIQYLRTRKSRAVARASRTRSRVRSKAVAPTVKRKATTRRRKASATPKRQRRTPSKVTSRSTKRRTAQTRKSSITKRRAATRKTRRKAPIKKRTRVARVRNKQNVRKR